MKLTIATLALLGMFTVAHAEESLGEKAEATTKSAARTAKKGWHRTQEAVCGKMTGDDKVECLAKQAKNRMEEGKDAVVDKADEVKNNMDSDKKK